MMKLDLAAFLAALSEEQEGLRDDQSKAAVGMHNGLALAKSIACMMAEEDESNG